MSTSFFRAPIRALTLAATIFTVTTTAALADHIRSMPHEAALGCDDKAEFVLQEINTHLNFYGSAVQVLDGPFPIDQLGPYATEYELDARVEESKVEARILALKEAQAMGNCSRETTAEINAEIVNYAADVAESKGTFDQIVESVLAAYANFQENADRVRDNHRRRVASERLLDSISGWDRHGLPGGRAAIDPRDAW